MDSECILIYLDEANEARNRLQEITSLKNQYRTDLCGAKRFSQSNLELNAITSLKSKFTLF